MRPRRQLHPMLHSGRTSVYQLPYSIRGDLVQDLWDKLEFPVQRDLPVLFILDRVLRLYEK